MIAAIFVVPGLLLRHQSSRCEGRVIFAFDFSDVIRHILGERGSMVPVTG